MSESLNRLRTDNIVSETNFSVNNRSSIEDDSSQKIYLNKKDSSSALPPSKPEFIEMLPGSLFSIFKEFHVIYFTIVSLLLFFRYCGSQIGPLVAQIGLVIAYILVQLAAKYLTWKAFGSNPFSHQPYQILIEKGIQKVEYEDLRVGQILKINKKQRVPVVLLPIAVASDKKHLLIDAFPIDKTQDLQRIQIIQQLSEILEPNHASLNQQKIQKFVIKYTFTSSMGSLFQAQIQDLYHNQTLHEIKNSNTIKRGTMINTQQYVIGIIMHSLELQSMRELRQVLTKPNGMNKVLINHLIVVIILNILISVVFVVIASITIFADNYYESYGQLGCYFLNTLALLSQSVHITMYIFLSIRRLVDAIILSKKKFIQVRNFIKSLDQFGIADTIITDDYFFLKRKLLQVHQLVTEESYMRSKLDIQVILEVFERSQQLKALYTDQWLALYRRQKKQYQFRRKNVQIGRSGFRSDKCFGICIKVDQEQYLLNFSERARFSTLQSLDLTESHRFSLTIKKCKQDGQLMIMVEVAQIRGFQKSQSMLLRQNQLRLHSLLSFKFISAQQPTQFLRNLIPEYNFILMTNKTWDLTQNLLQYTSLKTLAHEIIVFEQQQLKFFKEQLRYRVQQLQEQDRFEKKHIYAFDSSLITHLSRKQVRQGIKILAKRSRYIVFFNCSQYQKQICATNVFHIFPHNLFFSNFLCDELICRRSNLSACLKIAPASPFTTVQLDSYSSLHQLLTNDASHSIRKALIIIYGHIFKNQMFISSSIIAMFLVYRGSNFYTGLEYSQYFFLLYNVFFSMIPLLYYLITRPSIYRTRTFPKFTTQILLKQHGKGLLIGLILTLFSYCFVMEQFVPNLFLIIAINCIIGSNFYYLTLDRGLSKWKPILAISVQCCLVIGLFFLLLLVDKPPSDTIILIEVSVISEHLFFFLSAFIFNPIFILIILYLFAFFSSQSEEKQEIVVQQRSILPTFLGPNMIAKVNKHHGKQMRFRYAEDNMIQQDFSDAESFLSARISGIGDNPKSNNNIQDQIE